MLLREREGWAPLYRRIFTSDVWLGQSATTKVIAVWVIGSIRHTGNVDTPAGAVDCTLDEIGRACNTTRNTTRSALAALEAIAFVRVTRSRYGLRVAIVDWRRWLGVANASSEHATDDARHDENETSSSASDAQPLTPRGATVAPLSLKEDREGSVASQQSLLAAQKLTGYRESIDAFHQRYKAAYKQAPTWRAAEGAQLKRLLAAHGADEVQRRIAVLFDAPPRWLRPPFTFSTLVKHFDHLVVAVAAAPTSGRRGGMTPAEILAHARGGLK